MPPVPYSGSGTFTVDDLIACYKRGVFPMSDTADDDSIYLVDPEQRGVLPLDSLHIPRRLARTVRSDRFQVRIDTAFEAVLEACAAPRSNRPDTWISGPIKALYMDLYRRGLAHSVETWRDGELAGGLYGVSLGAAFFGESMVSFERDASKVALAHLAGRLLAGRYRLLDAQFMTEHLSQFGGQTIPRARYRKQLSAALAEEADFFHMAAYAAGKPRSYRRSTTHRRLGAAACSRLANWRTSSPETPAAAAAPAAIGSLGLGDDLHVSGGVDDAFIAGGGFTSAHGEDQRLVADRRVER